MGVSTRTSFEFAGHGGLTALGSSVQAGNIDEFSVRGTQWGFVRASITYLDMASFQHDASAGTPLGFPPPGSVSVVFVLEGTLHVTLNGSSFVFIAGSAAVVPSDQLPRIICENAARVLFVTVTNAQHPDLAGLLPDQPTGISAAVVRSHPALPFLLGLTHTATTHAIRTNPTGSIITRLLAELLIADRAWHTRPGRPAFTEILHLISTHHPDPGLDLKKLARLNSMSPTALADILHDQADGKHAAELITERRLITAMTLLHPEHALTITQIANRCGFTTTLALETHLENAYGVTATDLLETQQPARTRRTRDPSPDGGQRRVSTTAAMASKMDL